MSIRSCARTPSRGLISRCAAYYSPHPDVRGSPRRDAAMALMDFIKKQFIDIIEWTEDGDGMLAWRFPMEDREIQNGGSLTVRESQIAMFVNEGKVADVFGPGRYTLDHRDAAGPDLPAELGQALQEPVQERRLLLQHAPADRPALGHDPAGDDPRQGLRRGAPARLRQLRLPRSSIRACSTPRSRARASTTPSPTSTASCAA